MNLTAKMLIFSILGLASGLISAFPQALVHNAMEYEGGYLLASASLCIMAVSTDSVLRRSKLKGWQLLTGKLLFVVFLAIYFLAFFLNPLTTPFDPEQIDFEVVGAISFIICLALVWNNYRIARGIEANGGIKG